MISMTTLKKLFPLLFIVLIGMLVLLYEPKTASDALLKEFTNAYVADIEANGNVQEVSLIAEPSNIAISEDINLEVWTYNQQVPGPEIRIQLGDTVKIDFKNNLPQETTIHFHGIRVPNAMDGVPGVTQEAIPPGGAFTYEFTPKDPGTYWYHPHVRGSEQVERGLYGTLVVENPTDPKYDIDKTLVLDDWRLDNTLQIDPSFNTPHDLSHDGRWGNVITVNGSTNPTFNAAPGERMRLRFVNASNARVYRLDFGDLKAKAFAVDGLYAKETFSAQGFELSPGNRLDVDITMPLVSVSTSYVINDSFLRQPYSLLTINQGAEVIDQKTFPPPTAQNFPRWSEALEAPLQKEYVMDARRGGSLGIEWLINGQAYPNYDPITLEYGKFNKIRFTNKSARLHPMHLHGQFFKVLARNGVAVDEPFWRDTVLIHSRETVDIGVVPLDKGKWANHCHILEHAEVGMMTIVNVE